MPEMTHLPGPEDAKAAELLPAGHWLHGDDKCNCVFQRLGEWTNPYIGRTLRVRFCCIWAELHKMFPQFVQEIPAYYDSNRHEWEIGTREWDDPDWDMPLPLWYRQLAQRSGKDLDSVRKEYSKRTNERPRKKSGLKRIEPTAEEVARAHKARRKIAGYNVGED